MEISKKIRLETCILSLMILFFLNRSAVPFLKYLFMIIYPIFFLYWIYHFVYSIKANKKDKFNFKVFISYYLIPIILLIILIFYFFVSEKIYLLIFKEIISAVILLSFFFMMSSLINTEEKLNYFITGFLRLLILFSFIVAVFTFFVQFDILSFQDFAPQNSIAKGTLQKTVDIDNNFATIPLFFGLIIILFSENILKQGIKHLLIKLIFISFLLLVIFLSGSRRALFLVVIIAFSFTAIKILYFIYREHSEKFRSLNNSANVFLGSILMLIIIASSFLFLTPYKAKYSFLSTIGTRDVASAFNRVTMNLFDYVKIINSGASYDNFYKQLWRPVFDSNDPNSGWGTRRHSTIENLTGDNAGIIPIGSKGYLLDSSCNADYREGNAYAFTKIWNDAIKNENVEGASVFCYVSPDFNGDYAMMALEGSGDEYKRVNYDMNRKGEWQKLNLDFVYNHNSPPVYMYIAKFNANDFSGLKGYVIFAHPEIRASKKIIPEIKFPIKENCFISFPLNWIKYFSLVGHNVVDSLSPDKDPFRKFISDFVSEDTTYTSMKIKTISNEKYDNFILLRQAHMRFAIYIFFNEYNFLQQIGGGGFTYLNWFGYYFTNDKKESDYPHNPFLSILLYSGLIGLIFYLLLLYKVISLYMKYIKISAFLFIFFIITSYFSFFSANDPFDPPIMGFFIFLPFYINHIKNRITKQ